VVKTPAAGGQPRYSVSHLLNSPFGECVALRISSSSSFKKNKNLALPICESMSSETLLAVEPQGSPPTTASVISPDRHWSPELAGQIGVRLKGSAHRQGCAPRSSMATVCEPSPLQSLTKDEYPAHNE